MEIGLSGKGFGNWLILAVIISVAVSFIAVVVARRMRVDITKFSFQMPLIMALVLFLIMIPFWLTEIDMMSKIIVSIIAILVGVVNYLFLNKAQAFFTGIKNKDK